MLNACQLGNDLPDIDGVLRQLLGYLLVLVGVAGGNGKDRPVTRE